MTTSIFRHLELFLSSIVFYCLCIEKNGCSVVASSPFFLFNLFFTLSLVFQFPRCLTTMLHVKVLYETDYGIQN